MWHSEDMAEIECIFLEEFMEDPHIWNGNRDVAEFLSVTFHDVPFFYLSHFAWIGEEIGKTSVTIQVTVIPPLASTAHRSLILAFARPLAPSPSPHLLQPPRTNLSHP